MPHSRHQSFNTRSNPPLDSIFSARCLKQAWAQSDAGTVILFALLTAVVLWCIGCESSPSSSKSASSGTSSTPSQTDAQLERDYAVGPAAARDLDYRIDWQYADPSRNIKNFWVQDDSVFLVDSKNNLTRLRIEQGDRLWRLPVAGPIDEIAGVRFLPSLQRLAVITGGYIYIHDAQAGSMLSKQMLQKIAATNAAAFGPYLIYGARTGQVMWHAYGAGSEWRGFQVASSVQVPPVLAGNYLIAVGNDGNLVVLAADSASLLWSKRMQDGVVTSPVAGNDAVYLAGLDQHLRGFDLPTGRKIWDILFDQPLRDDPTLIGERIYQHVPARGLVCCNAVPQDAPGGEQLWFVQGLHANVLTSRNNMLIAWSPQDHKVSVLDPRRGAIVKTIDLPQVSTLWASAPENGDLFASTDDGRIIRLVPRN